MEGNGNRPDHISPQYWDELQLGHARALGRSEQAEKADLPFNEWVAMKEKVKRENQRQAEIDEDNMQYMAEIDKSQAPIVQPPNGRPIEFKLTGKSLKPGQRGR